MPVRQPGGPHDHCALGMGGGALCGAQVGLLETVTPPPASWLDSGCADIGLQIDFYGGIKVKYFFLIFFFLVCPPVLYFFNLAFFKSCSWLALTSDPSCPRCFIIHDLILQPDSRPAVPPLPSLGN